MEDEIICYILNRDGELYKKEDWINDYKKWIHSLFDPKKKDQELCIDPYKDPDGNCKQFYDKLVSFLNNREDKVKLGEKYTYEFCDTDPFGIEVRKKVSDGKSGVLFYLKSDQFGFSVPSKNKDHPYDIFIEQCDNDKRDTELENVAKWIYYSRTLGGSFLWPMEIGIDGEWINNPRYNMARGGAKGSAGKKQYHIEDRVDLTLLEIKQVYDGCGINMLANNILYRNCFSSPNMRKWLLHFGTFKNYVEFFCFDDCFIDMKTMKPYDITRSNNSLLDNKPEEYMKKKIFINKESMMSKDDLGNMFDEVKKRIIDRTKKMNEYSTS